MLLAQNDRGSGVNYGRAGNRLQVDYTDWPAVGEVPVKVLH